MAKYNADQCNTELDILNQGLTDTWCIQAGKLYKKFTFANFSQAFAFMTQIALYAEKANHHPEWTNNYKHVEVHLISHDVGGLSARDFELAQYMECCVLPYLGKSGARLGK